MDDGHETQQPPAQTKSLLTTCSHLLPFLDRAVFPRIYKKISFTQYIPRGITATPLMGSLF